MPTREYKLSDRQVCAAFVQWLGIPDIRAPAKMEISLHPSGSATITIEEPEPPPPEPAPAPLPPPPPPPRPVKVLPAYEPAAYTQER